MINFIKNILEENDYILVEKTSDIAYFFENGSENKNDYYLIYDMGYYKSADQLNESIEHSEVVFDSMREYREDVEKNTTAVYLLKTDKEIGTSNPLWHRICEIEEMVAYMKRNVLIYTQAEQNEISEMQGDLTVQIRKYLKLNDNFKRFKYEDDLRYGILSKIFIKLHCLTYNFESKDFIDIEENIKTTLSNVDNEKLNDNFGFVLNGLNEVEQKNKPIDKFLDDYIHVLQNNKDSRITDDLIEDRIKTKLQGRG